MLFRGNGNGYRKLTIGTITRNSLSSTCRGTGRGPPITPNGKNIVHNMMIFDFV